MLIVSPEPGTGWPDGLLACLLGDPWSVRLAGAGTACPALELYEAGDLLDVVTATSVARTLLRGARATGSAAGPRAVAWGRVPASGLPPDVRFAGRRAAAQPAAVFLPGSWCWIAVADGRCTTVTASTGEESARRRLDRRRPCC